MAKRAFSSVCDEGCDGIGLPTSKRRKLNSDKSIDDDSAADCWEDIDFEDKDNDIFDDAQETTDDWGEDTEQILAHNFRSDGPTTPAIILSATTSNSNTSSTCSEYTECWICTNCSAMNRLLDTLSLHNMCCAVCQFATYIPGKTDIVQSFEWDKNQSNTSIPINSSAVDPNHKDIDSVCVLSRAELKHSLSINSAVSTANVIPTVVVERPHTPIPSRGVTKKDMDILIVGIMRSNKVNAGNVPEDVTRLVILWFGDYDGWEIKRNPIDFEMNKDLRICKRTEQSAGLWRNRYGSREFKATAQQVRYEWTLQCFGVRNGSQSRDTPAEGIMVGVIEAKDAMINENVPFTHFTDINGWYGTFGCVHCDVSFYESMTQCRCNKQ